MTLVDRVTISGGQRFGGKVKVPGDKSITHRALLLGALGQDVTALINWSRGEDNLRTLKALSQMGIEVKEDGEGKLLIAGHGLYGLKEPEEIIDVGNSGTTIRLLAGLLSGQRFFAVLTGDSSLKNRPMDRVVAPLRQMGAMIHGRQGGRYAPLSIDGRRLKPLCYELPVASAQVKSALLLAGLYAEGETEIYEPVKCRDHTEKLLSYLGANFKQEGSLLTIKGNGEWKGNVIQIPGDLSSAAYFLVAGLVAPDSEVTVEEVGVNPTRTGILDALKAMGGEIEVKDKGYLGLEPVADITVRSSHLKGISLGGSDIPGVVDEIPVLAVAAAFAQGTTEIREAGELRVKETDRIKGVSQNLRRFGVTVEEFSDGMRITGSASLKGFTLKGTHCNSFGDHRLAMAMHVMASLVCGETVLEGADCIAVSFPGFFEAFQRIEQ